MKRILVALLLALSAAPLAADTLVAVPIYQRSWGGWVFVGWQWQRVPDRGVESPPVQYQQMPATRPDCPPGGT